MSAIRILSSEEARRSILQRKPLDETALTPEMAERNRHLFGEALTPDQVAAKIISLFAINEQAAQRLGPAAITMAEAEGLTAHAASVKQRLSSHDE